MSNAKQKAIEICQNMAYTSRFSLFNEGRTLPLHIAKQCAIHCVNEMIALVDTLDGNKKITNFYNNVKTEIELL